MINFLRMCAYRVAFRNCCLQHLNQPVKKQSVAFTEPEADIFATDVLRVLPRQVTAAQPMRSSLLSRSDLPTRWEVFESSVWAAHVGAMKDVTVPRCLSTPVWAGGAEGTVSLLFQL